MPRSSCPITGRACRPRRRRGCSSASTGSTHHEPAATAAAGSGCPSSPPLSPPTAAPFRRIGPRGGHDGDGAASRSFAEADRHVAETVETGRDRRRVLRCHGGRCRSTGRLTAPAYPKAQLMPTARERQDAPMTVLALPEPGTAHARPPSTSRSSFRSTTRPCT